jgi:hypothetical protein
MVNTALCRSCGENADFTPDAGDVRRLKRILAITAIGITFLVVLAIWANSTITTY